MDILIILETVLFWECAAAVIFLILQQGAKRKVGSDYQEGSSKRAWLP